MNERLNYIIAGARVVDPANGVDEIRDLGVADGLFADPAKVKNPVRLDFKGRVAAPGFIDMHVHLRQPGGTDAETIRTGTMAAAAGGFTTIVAMPNTKPCADSVGTIEYIRRHTAAEAVVNVLPTGTITKGMEGKEMSGIGGLKRAGVVALTDDGNCVQDNELMLHVLEYSKSFNLPILDHCQDTALSAGGVAHDGYWGALTGLRGIPSAAEDIIVARDIILSHATGHKIHLQHLSSRESVLMLRHALARGVPVSAEATPHHIALTDERIRDFDTNFKMNPPLRSEEDRLAIIEGLMDGSIAVIATDHAPHTETAKLVEFAYAPFGVIGLETAVPVCLTVLHREHGMGLSQLIAKFTLGPASVLNLDIGRIADGLKADLTILDLEKDHRVDPDKFRSKARNTAFAGYQAKGKAVATMVAGRFVFSELPDVEGMV